MTKSGGRFNVYFSFSKEEIKLFEREMLLNRDYWLEAMHAAIQAQKEGWTEEELQERINEIKRKGDFV